MSKLKKFSIWEAILAAYFLHYILITPTFSAEINPLFVEFFMSTNPQPNAYIYIENKKPSNFMHFNRLLPR